MRVCALKRAGNSEADYGQEAIDTLCKLMDEYKGKFVVVAAWIPRRDSGLYQIESGTCKPFLN
ncbi:MAG: hypothetical protein ACLUD0_06760 [Eubacterium ramulus]